MATQALPQPISMVARFGVQIPTLDDSIPEARGLVFGWGGLGGMGWGIRVWGLGFGV